MLDKCQMEVLEQLRKQRIDHWQQFNDGTIDGQTMADYFSVTPLEKLLRGHERFRTALQEYNESRERDGY